MRNLSEKFTISSESPFTIIKIEGGWTYPATTRSYKTAYGAAQAALGDIRATVFFAEKQVKDAETCEKHSCYYGGLNGTHVSAGGCDLEFFFKPFPCRPEPKIGIRKQAEDSLINWLAYTKPNGSLLKTYGSRADEVREVRERARQALDSIRNCAQKKLPEELIKESREACKKIIDLFNFQGPWNRFKFKKRGGLRPQDIHDSWMSFRESGKTTAD
ncbi:MAG: hypothetical protein DRJ03_02885 [Chloroflexi bacterium]|nr:MAG: hypothetical protein DRJ03_02885 [Chloroflexota bacterium]